jgi:hypothetical protein
MVHGRSARFLSAILAKPSRVTSVIKKVTNGTLILQNMKLQAKEIVCLAKYNGN